MNAIHRYSSNGCECLGHPNNCFEHPTNCGCNAKTATLTLAEAKSKAQQILESGRWVNFNAKPGEVSLDGFYTAADLEAIIVVMRGELPTGLKP